MTGELRAALERVLRRARGVEEKAAAREVHRILESLDLLVRGGATHVAHVAAPVELPAATVPDLAPRTGTRHGPRSVSAVRNHFVRALHTRMSLEQIHTLTFGDVTKAGEIFAVSVAGSPDALLFRDGDAQMLRDLLRWGWGPTIDSGTQPQPSWPVLPREPGATEPPTLRQLQHAVTERAASNAAA